MRVYALVIWYNPCAEYVQNLLTYARVLDGVIVVDNSGASNARLLSNVPGVQYLCDHQNKGMAGALNVGFRNAIGQGADWVLTMDQDSSFETGIIKNLLTRASQMATDQRIAIFAPRTQVGPFSSIVEDRDGAITSGSLVNTSAYREIGGYNEFLFIDGVDHEFGYRLKRAGYRVLLFNDLMMSHTVGEPFTRRVLWRDVTTTNHGYIRKYYMTRSRLYIWRNYPEFGGPYLKMIWIDFLKVLLVEKEKYLKVKYMLKGAIDYFRGVGGRLG